jgi:energy-coupling factor transporter ATP-binding protein EcfA2
MMHTELNLDGLGGVNVLIGENDTGKTALLKLLYATTKALEQYFLQLAHKNEPFSRTLAAKLLSTFQPPRNGLGELVSRGNGTKLVAELTYADTACLNLRYAFGPSTTAHISDCTEHIERYSPEVCTLFVPAKEVLTAFEAIAATRETLDMYGFDDTYYDLIKALRLPIQRGMPAEELREASNELERLFSGRIEPAAKAGMPFVFRRGNVEFTMPTTAEGIKKIGILSTLISNRQLRRRAVLFLDEPETALHPRAIRKLADILHLFAASNIQVFLSTHNFFLIKQLEIIARRHQTNYTCTSIVQGTNNKLTSTTTLLRDGLPSNPIIDETLAMLQDELSLTYPAA